MYGIKPDITIKYILQRVSQEDIFSYYLGVHIVYREFFCSPLRNDKNPTCSFKKCNDGNVLFRDWAEPKALTCFTLIQQIYNCSFVEALYHIYTDMILDDKPPVYHYEETITTEYKRSQKSNIQIAFGDWQPEVKEYLKAYHITPALCKKFNIYPINTVYLNGKIHYKYNKYDPAIAYYFGDNNKEQRWKIYFFKRKNVYRFLCNTNRINGWIQLPNKGEHLIITKSLKDVACLDIFNISAIAMQNETTLPYDYIIEELQSRFTTIYSLYDYDNTGITLATQLEELYNIKPLFFKNVEEVKDFSDYVKKHGKQKTQKLINYVKTILEKNN